MASNEKLHWRQGNLEHLDALGTAEPFGVTHARAWRDHFAQEMAIKLGQRNVELAQLQSRFYWVCGIAVASLIINAVAIDLIVRLCEMP